MTPTRWSDDEAPDPLSDPNEHFDLVDIINLIEIRAAVQEEFPPEDYRDDDEDPT